MDAVVCNEALSLQDNGNKIILINNNKEFLNKQKILQTHLRTELR